MNKKIVFTLDEAADYLMVHPQTLYKMCRNGQLPAAKVGRSWRFHRDILDSFLKGEFQNGGNQEKVYHPG
ncbi:helix-turn-helix domain-containing protein [Desmospora activa]|uniref:Excisionase family DNA binding protein n=1 Tax=Desmospora activa DSM 45169 TaxID=1121389 RepID=A0A2T4YZN5_9BACL|nr:helix-turn-helix domain-containing protein [Desmospora activa]PTM52702.1 excisionase family DNA binding protein [Desmospora activa DSM 45169]